jgi:hypothetical protein
MASNPRRLGELFVSLEPTTEESQRSRGRYQYQQVVINSLIQEFGIKVTVIVQIPPRARFQINRASSQSGEIQPGCPPGEIRPLGLCMHLGYVSDFIIIRGVPEYSTAECNYRHQWQLPSRTVDKFITQLINQGEGYHQE